MDSKLNDKVWHHAEEGQTFGRLCLLTEPQLMDGSRPAYALTVAVVGIAAQSAPAASQRHPGYSWLTAFHCSRDHVLCSLHTCTSSKKRSAPSGDHDRCTSNVMLPCQVGDTKGRKGRAGEKSVNSSATSNARGSQDTDMAKKQGRTTANSKHKHSLWALQLAWLG